MSDEEISRLLRQAPFSFVGTVEHLGAATMTNLPIDDRTAVVRVEHVLHSPEAFSTLQGQRITLQLAADKEPPAVGDTLAFFAEGLAFGESIAVTEVGRLPVDVVEPRVTSALAAGEPGAFATLQREIAMGRLRDHADTADAIVVGRVARLEKAVPSGYSEHDPDWWQATLDVHHVERGAVEPGPLRVLYANSLDVGWRASPKPKASQEGLWILHATEGELATVAPFQIVHPEDYQPVQSLDALRAREG
jgi:hypothetical protein